MRAYLLMAGLCLAGCTTSGVGDPCVLERLPESGSLRDQAYTETSSVQCRTRVCLLYDLRGNPRHVLGEDSCPCEDGTIPMLTDAGTPSCTLRFDDCVVPDELEKHMHCSCRCGALPGSTSSAPLCDCPSGYVCEGEVPHGGDGNEGLYCIHAAR